MPKTPDYFAGKTIVITGAASGIGRATALIFAREGANVVCADLNEAGARETAAQVNGKGSQALALKVDVTKRARRSTTWSSARSTPSAACSSCSTRRARRSAAPSSSRSTTICSTAPSTSTSRARSTACRRCCRTCCKNKFGVIVNVGSMAHRRGGPGSSIHYAAAKGAVVTMTMGVAREFATQGIRALSISPGPIKTPFQDAAATSPELVQQFLDDVPMKRFGEPEEIGELVLFMCSDACPFMTADTVYVNGGGGWR